LRCTSFDPPAVTKIHAATLFAVFLLHNSVVLVKTFVWKHSFYNDPCSNSFPHTFNYNLLLHDTLKMEAAWSPKQQDIHILHRLVAQNAVV
jgi:hypothetical protein